MNALLRVFSICVIVLFCGCEKNRSIVGNVDERDANEIVVFLASKGIQAHKMEGSSAPTAGPGTMALFNIEVNPQDSTKAMALLTRAGLPRRQGTNLLELFAKSGLMSSDREETIRYNAGLAEQLKNTIRKIDGVIDADVQLSFPPSEQLPGMPPQKTTAAVYIKHQGILEDPNSHLETKIKRLLAGSVNGLEYDNVSVISDRSRFSDISIDTPTERIGEKGVPQTYVRLWSIVMTQPSAMRFRVIFFTMIGLILAMGTAIGCLVYRFYPQIFNKKESEPK